MRREFPTSGALLLPGASFLSSPAHAMAGRILSDEQHRRFPLGGYGMAVAMEPFKKDQFEGAVPTIYAVTTTTESGQYICPPAIPEPGSQLAQSDELADRLMELTKKVILEKGPIDELVLS